MPSGAALAGCDADVFVGAFDDDVAAWFTARFSSPPPSAEENP
jgi:hypothetical protein